MDEHVNKVYINPNFNKPHNSTINIGRAHFSNMHVNPAFSQITKTTNIIQKNTKDALQSKIFINPNFIRATKTWTHNQPATARDTAHIALLSDVQPTISKTRYTLVRRENPINENIKVTEKPKHTITIGKYKSIAVKDFKKSLEAVPHQNVTCNLNNYKTNIIQSRKYNTSMVAQNSILNKAIEVPSKKYTSKYKFVKKSSTDNMANKKVLFTNKFNILPKYSCIKTMGKLKKNNLPCPLFRKYGRCPKRDNGLCDFLHDKKHVSLCRKFLKGLCFDQECLFSHDLSSNKMPTCYFYLNGVCSKEYCPYLHVKLNENATVCSDFLKGYCEKGSACAKRHINVKGSKRKFSTTKDNKKTNHDFKSKKKIKNNVSIKSKKQETVSKIELPEKDNVKESRYYKETLDSSDICEIKPSRCKIGTLPSFIKL